MTKEALQSVIGRAVTDADFRHTLFANPDVALVDYDLTPEELASLIAIDYETMDDVAGTLDDRMSKVAWNVFDSAVPSSEVAELDAGGLEGGGSELEGVDLDVDAVIKAAAGMDRGDSDVEGIELESATIERSEVTIESTELEESATGSSNSRVKSARVGSGQG
jgi:hypothetical protein